jgi:hypothetical protein
MSSRIGLRIGVLSLFWKTFVTRRLTRVVIPDAHGPPSMKPV